MRQTRDSTGIKLAGKFFLKVCQSPLMFFLQLKL